LIGLAGSGDEIGPGHEQLAGIKVQGHQFPRLIVVDERDRLQQAHARDGLSLAINERERIGSQEIDTTGKMPVNFTELEGQRPRRRSPTGHRRM
jgi:hypothetical protein